MCKGVQGSPLMRRQLRVNSLRVCRGQGGRMRQCGRGHAAVAYRFRAFSRRPSSAALRRVAGERASPPDPRTSRAAQPASPPRRQTRTTTSR
ncbi:unnamed protein product [Pieris brassicae]|uniref:Uncharacterized protein n=1 Tax=Pieris brassicae TaxID=7116 RepID=A0A9P0TBV1_PIEBR|nr:unnamed protein product [Pieris brassicae]